MDIIPTYVIYQTKLDCLWSGIESNSSQAEHGILHAAYQTHSTTYRPWRSVVASRCTEFVIRRVLFKTSLSPANSTLGDKFSWKPKSRRLMEDLHGLSNSEPPDGWRYRQHHCCPRRGRNDTVKTVKISQAITASSTSQSLLVLPTRVKASARLLT